jgi:uncharacterized protein (UPF0332 family)
MKEFAAVEWDRAHKALASARQLAHNDPDSAASRAYYAAFHALTSVFALRGETFTKHSAIRAALHRDLIQPGLVPAENGRDYDFLMELRETGDYGGMSQVTRENAQTAISKADLFLHAMDRLREEKTS